MFSLAEVWSKRNELIDGKIIAYFEELETQVFGESSSLLVGDDMPVGVDIVLVADKTAGHLDVERAKLADPFFDVFKWFSISQIEDDDDNC